MSKLTLDRIEYIVAFLSEFAKAYRISDVDAFKYINQYRGIEMINEHYDAMHTLSFPDVIESMSVYCKRMGGALV